MFSEIYCIVEGQVLAVGYRAFVENVARERGVTGWVRNNTEKGTVEIVFQGIPDVLKECIEDLHRGSVLSKVSSVGVDWRTPKEQFDEFKILPSAS
jgi:acylphosphatase